MEELSSMRRAHFARGISTFANWFCAAIRIILFEGLIALGGVSPHSQTQSKQPRRRMSVALNAQLIDAVEDGLEADVKRLIEAGASPDALKKVTLRARVHDGKGPYALHGRGFEWKEDMVECESALLLAILYARVAVVLVRERPSTAKSSGESATGTEIAIGVRTNGSTVDGCSRTTSPPRLLRPLVGWIER
ncbi:hypothetical protein M427DRAFT_56350 [Gonapodya prolifera JEL478]|uniref:Uncharacterized protein n=1 Tax=Gonapodya prolifera (strain JEL478) TaxID=1344416 RepID=A0A139AI27_GONPJ|nr:hypothetical protein M427DRAFT_56350 [Gonapodya prolifera JEL478]|eukprot:KXS16063.1 hypothetical protein M427DRAFT_56350 [Gonapodya prolifera JEL478]